MYRSPDILLRQFFLSFFLSCLVDIDDGVLLLYSRRSSMRVFLFHDLPYTKKLSIAPGQRT